MVGTTGKKKKKKKKRGKSKPPPVNVQDAIAAELRQLRGEPALPSPASASPSSATASASPASSAIAGRSKPPSSVGAKRPRPGSTLAGAAASRPSAAKAAKGTKAAAKGAAKAAKGNAHRTRPSVSDGAKDDGGGVRCAEADMVAGLEVVCERKNSLERGTVVKPSKKGKGMWVVKFATDGKLLPRAPNQMVERTNADDDSFSDSGSDSHSDAGSDSGAKGAGGGAVRPVLVAYTDTKLGEGEEEVRRGARIDVMYEGYLKETGRMFDGNWDGKPPLAFSVGNEEVVEGFEDGVLGMRQGGERTFVVPADLGYGGEERPGIPANSTLEFKVTVVGISSF